MVQVGVPAAPFPVVAVAGLTADLAVPATVGDATELLDVDVHQLARLGHLVADGLGPAHGQARGLVEVREQRHAVPDQHPPDRGTREVQVVADPVRAPAVAEAQCHDPPLGPLRQSRGRAPWPRAVIGQRLSSPTSPGPA